MRNFYIKFKKVKAKFYHYIIHGVEGDLGEPKTPLNLTVKRTTQKLIEDPLKL